MSHEALQEHENGRSSSPPTAGEEPPTTGRRPGSQVREIDNWTSDIGVGGAPPGMGMARSGRRTWGARNGAARPRNTNARIRVKISSVHSTPMKHAAAPSAPSVGTATVSALAVVPRQVVQVELLQA